jgi:predicted negative regulator of RcsB-dependent stress response
MTRYVLHALDFFAQYAKECVAGLTLLLVALFAAYTYQEHLVAQTQQASLAYYHLTQAENSSIADYQSFVDHQPQSVFTTFAWMKMAKMHAERQDLPSAEHALIQAKTHVSDSKMQDLLTLRLAKLSLLAEKPQAALDYLQSMQGNTLAFVRDLTKIDAYIALGKSHQAQTLIQALTQTDTADQQPTSQQGFAFKQMLASKQQQLEKIRVNTTTKNN